ncbi:MAG: LPS assembly lipoprotein LptE [Chlamydiales bacterium]
MKIYLLLFLFLTSCGYRFGQGNLSNCYSTICIPYVQGDEKGLLTNALIRTITTRTALTYSSQGAQLLLKVCLFEPIERNIGFDYSTIPGEDNIVVSNEGRLTLTAEVSLIDQCTGGCLMGPMKITSWIDYDFEPDLSNVNFHDFALGQLQMNNLAKDAAYPPLYILLAEKIVDYVDHSW